MKAQKVIMQKLFKPQFFKKKCVLMDSKKVKY